MVGGGGDVIVPSRAILEILEEAEHTPLTQLCGPR